MKIDISNISNFCKEDVPVSVKLTAYVSSDNAEPLLDWGILYLISLGAKANPKVGRLAYHAKTRRVRIKNLKRLYKIGYLINKRGD